MPELPPEPGRSEFTIGRVLRTAWRGFARHFVMVSAICLIAGGAGVILPLIVAANITAGSLLLWRPLIEELLQAAIAIAILVPALILLLRAQEGRITTLREVLAQAGRRVAVVVAAETVADALLVAPAYFLFPADASPGVRVAIALAFLAYEILLLAFNYVFLSTLAAESGGTAKALRRAFRLASGHWLRLLVIAFMLWLVSWGILFGVSVATGLIFDLILRWSWSWIWIWSWPVHQAVSLCLGYALRLLVVAPVAVAIYHLLQREKDGLPAREAARVFD